MAITQIDPRPQPLQVAPPRTARAEVGGLLSLPVSEVHEVRVGEALRVEGRKHRHPLAKLAFFAVTEGPTTTFRKARAVMTERRITARQKIVIAAIDLDGQRFIGVTRRMGGPLLFEPRLVFRDPMRRAPAEIDLPGAVVASLEGWLPVPSCPFDASMPGEIVSSVPRLERVEDDTVLRRAAREDAGPTDRIRERRAVRARQAAADRDSVWLLGHGSYVRQAVVPWFRDRVGAALDYRAGLMRDELPTPYPIVAAEESILEGIAADRTPLVIVSTYHSDHVPLAESALAANPDARVFVQKPAGVELAEIEWLLEMRRRGYWIDVGYNRRHAPLAIELLERAAELPRPLVATMTIKELKISPAHWYFWENQGTRITGNLSHWIDLAYAIVERPLVELNLTPSGDTVTLALRFDDDSLVTLIATDRGDDLRGVEDRIEVRGGGTTLTIDDFRYAQWRSGSNVRTKRRLRRDKGQARMYRDLRRRWLSGDDPGYPDDALYWTGYVTWHASRLLRTGTRRHEVGRGSGSRHANFRRRLILLPSLDS